MHATLSADAQPDDCPEPHRQLLRDYKAFHDANKFSPDAQYLIQTCWSEDCQGTGDRIRGAMWVLRVAIAHRRILLLDWTHPAPLTHFLTPNAIDWTVAGLDDSLLTQANEIEEYVFNAAVYEGQPAALEAFRATKKFNLTTNQHFYVNIMANVTPVEYDNKIPIGSCYYNFLFRFNTTIVERGEDHLRRLYGPDPAGSYIAWHWRHFDADGRVNGAVNITRLAATLDCARMLALAVGVHRPVLLVSDFTAFREFVRQRNLVNVVSAAIIARHLDNEAEKAAKAALLEQHPGDPQQQQHQHQQRKRNKANKANKRGAAGADGGPAPSAAADADAYADIFVDLYLLSRSRCLLTSRSGFSKLALWMGGEPLVRCHRDMVECREEVVWRRRRGRRSRG